MAGYVLHLIMEAVLVEKLDKPYFMTNSEWYYFDNDDKNRGVKLTDKAPAEAVKSYEEYCEKIKNVSFAD